MDALTQLDELGPLLAGTVTRITPEQLDNPTPSGMTVRGVLEHMIGGGTAFTAAYRNEAPGEADTSDVLGSFVPALTGLAESMHAPGALEQTIPAPFGDTPGDTFARYIVFDGLVHGWDMATATAQPYEPSDALVADAQAFAEDALAPMRDGDTFADPVEPPSSATPIERLAAFSGRQVR